MEDQAVSAFCGVWGCGKTWELPAYAGGVRYNLCAEHFAQMTTLRSGALIATPPSVAHVFRGFEPGRVNDPRSDL